MESLKSCVPSLAEMTSVPLTFVMEWGSELMLVLPSLFHSDRPCVPSSAEQNRVPFTFVRFWNY